jgi:hypothetical protein
MQRKGEADIRATVQNVSSRDEVKLFEYRRQASAIYARVPAGLPPTTFPPPPPPPSTGG